MGKRLLRAGLLAAFAGLTFLAVGALRGPGTASPALLRAASGLAQFLLAVAAVNTAALLAFEVVLPRLRLKAPALLVDLLLAAAYLAAGFLILADNGVNLTGIVATSAVVTAVIAFSLQETLGNVMGGMALHLERTLSAGDRVRVGAHEGVVKEIRWRQTTIEADAGHLVIVPNGTLMKESVIVLSRRSPKLPPLRRDIPFSVYYDRSPNAVIEAVERAFQREAGPNVAARPQARCVLLDFAPEAARYELRYWIEDFSLVDYTDSEMRSRLYYTLAREGMKVSIPSRAVIVVQKGEEVAERSREAESRRRLAALKGVDIFSALGEEELSLLASRLKRTPFARGESLTLQGARADWLYIIDDGEAEVTIASGDGSAKKTVARLLPGHFLGEMSLMTGEPRSATVVAATDVHCYRLDREGLQDVLAKRPALAESISLVLAKRRVELEAARRGLDAQSRQRLLSEAQRDLLSRIRGFFTLSQL